MNRFKYCSTNAATQFINVAGASTLFVLVNHFAAIAHPTGTLASNIFLAQSSPAPSTTSPAQPPKAGTTAQSSQLTPLDRQFVLEAAQGGMAEVALAQLALQRSKNNAVRQYAQRMIKEHTLANQELMQLAKQKQIAPPTTLGKYEAVRAQLSQLSGQAFDQAYLNDAGVNSHMENLAVHRRQAQLGRDPELKAYAAKYTPIVTAHLQMAEQMAVRKAYQMQMR
jgi:putative membrane protein